MKLEINDQAVCATCRWFDPVKSKCHWFLSEAQNGFVTVAHTDWCSDWEEPIVGFRPVPGRRHVVETGSASTNDNEDREVKQ